MPAIKETKILGINDLRVVRITQDDAAAFEIAQSGSPATASSVDMRGIQTLALTPAFIEKELRGDEVVIDRYTKLDMINWSFTNAIMSLDALRELLGGTITASGTGTDETQTYTLKGTDLPYYFVLEAQTKYTDVGDVHVRLYKCKANKVDYELKGEDYAVVSVSGMAIPTQYDGKVKDVVINETAKNIDFSDLL